MSDPPPGLELLAKALKDIELGDIQTLRPRTLAEQSADRLRDLILLEKLPPGLALNERELSDRLGISRTPIRDAIRQLEQEGLVVYSRTRRPKVADPSLESLNHWLLVQGSLEGLAGEFACMHATDEELEKIAGFHEQMVELSGSDDRLHLFQLDMAFHSHIVAAAHNPALVETHQQYNSRLWRARFLSSQRRANRTQQMRKHQSIVDALMQRNSNAASAALQAHLRNAINNIKACAGGVVRPLLHVFGGLGQNSCHGMRCQFWPYFAKPGT